MGIAGLILQLSVSAAVVTTNEVSFFPGSYYDREARLRLQRRVMETWPGPSGVLELWRSGDLDEERQVAVLLGGAAYRDPKLTPMYAEALRSSSGRIRQAALYGYRDLLADQLPNVQGGVDEEVGMRAAREIRQLTWTWHVQPLVAMWLQAALRAEGRDLPGYHGAFLQRSARDSLVAVERLMTPDDIELLINAYRASGDWDTRLTLLRFIEALTLNKFIDMPEGQNAGWGKEIYLSAFARLDAWLGDWIDRRCEISSWRMLRESFRRLGARRVNPSSPAACALWQVVLSDTYPGWWPIAARHLYECGGPWIELSVVQAESPANKKARDELLKWYRINVRERRESEDDGRSEPPARPPGMR